MISYQTISSGLLTSCELAGAVRETQGSHEWDHNVLVTHGRTLGSRKSTAILYHCCAACAEFIFETVAGSVDGEDVALVEEPIEDR